MGVVQCKMPSNNMPAQQHAVVASLDQQIVRHVVATCVLGICSWLLAKAFLTLEARRDKDRDGPSRKGKFSRLRIPARQFNETERELVELALLLPEDVVCVNQDDLVGEVMNQVLRQTRHLVRMSLHTPVSNRQSVISQNRGLLLYGPPGTGKIPIAKVCPMIFRQIIYLPFTP